MDATSLTAILVTVYDAISALLPAWAQTALLAVFAIASAVTNLPWTPAQPAAEDGWRSWAAYYAYRAAEILALVGRNAKKRPDVAAVADSLAVQAKAGGLPADRAAVALQTLAKLAGG